MTLELLDLPHELIIQILHFLDLSNLLTCQRSCRFLHTSIAESVTLQYHLELKAAGYEDNPNCSLDIAERLKQLRSRESAFRDCRPDFTRSIPIPHAGSGIYELSGGTYMLGEATRKQLPTLKLPSVQSDRASWNYSLGFESEPDHFIVDAGLAVDEHDLVAVITSSVHPSTFTPEPGQLMTLELSFITASSSGPHPLARCPTIHLERAVFRRPVVGVEICGDHVALVTRDAYSSGTYENNFRIYDWKRGILKMEVKWKPGRHGHRDGYTNAIFLSPDVLVIPSHSNHALELWRIPAEPIANISKLFPDVTLKLPPLCAGIVSHSIVCRGAPNPVGHDYTPSSTAPFTVSAKDSVLIFHVRLLQANNMNMNMPGIISTFLFLHRRSLLDLLKPSPLHIPDEIDLAKRREREESDEDVEEEEGKEGQDVEIRWERWGPPISRWMTSGRIPLNWITTTYGQRFVLIPHDATSVRSPVIIFDFNRYNIKRARKLLEVDEANHPRLKISADLTDAYDSIFAGGVSSHMLFAACRTEIAYNFCGVLLDGERVLGLQRHDDGSGTLESIAVLHFG